MQDAHVKLNRVLSWQKQHSTGIRLFTSTFEAQLRKKLVNCNILNVAFYAAETDTSESRSEITGKFLNVVLEKDGDQLDHSCEK